MQCPHDVKCRYLSARSVLCAASQATQHVELALGHAKAGKALEEPRSIGAFRLARASFEEPANATAPRPSRAVSRDQCRVANASKVCEEPLQQALPRSAGRDEEDTDERMSDTDKEVDAGQSRLLQLNAAQAMQDKQQAPTNLSRVLAEQPAPEHNAQCQPDPALQPCVESLDIAEAICAPRAPELDMSPAWRRAVQCLSETGLSVFCPSKRSRLSAQL